MQIKQRMARADKIDLAALRELSSRIHTSIALAAAIKEKDIRNL